MNSFASIHMFKKHFRQHKHKDEEYVESKKSSSKCQFKQSFVLVPCGLVMLLLVKVEVSGSTYRGYWIFGIRVYPLSVLTKKQGVANQEMNLKNKPNFLVFGRLGLRKSNPCLKVQGQAERERSRRQVRTHKQHMPPFYHSRNYKLQFQLG